MHTLCKTKNFKFLRANNHIIVNLLSCIKLLMSETVDENVSVVGEGEVG